MTSLYIEYDVENHETAVSIYTERLKISSLQTSNYCNYRKLFTDADVMEKFQTGEPWSSQQFDNEFIKWRVKWRAHDPFSSLVITDKNSGDFYGHVMLTSGYNPGQAKLNYALVKNSWGNGFATEATDAVLNIYGDNLYNRGCSINGAPLTEIIATARDDNPASIKILEKIGMQNRGDVDSYGHRRLLFFKSFCETSAEEKAYNPEDKIIESTANYLKS